MFFNLYENVCRMDVSQNDEPSESVDCCKDLVSQVTADGGCEKKCDTHNG